MVCFIDFEKGCEITVLGCNPKHFLHKECLKSWMDHQKNKRAGATCPLCRVKIDSTKLKEKVFAGYLNNNATA